MPERQSRGGEPIHSELASDPEMLELIELFVAEMPEKIQQLSNAWASADRQAIESLAHQLKGCSGGYGYGIVGAAASRLESAVKKPHDDLKAIQREFDSLVDLCSRAAV